MTTETPAPIPAPIPSPDPSTSPGAQAWPGSGTPTDRLLTGSLLVAPVVYLAADTTYAARGWDDATAGVIHVLGALGYGFLVVRIATWLPAPSRLVAAIVLTGIVGLGGNVAYGFEAIHSSLGDVALVDQSGAATLIKPLGLFFPLSLLLVAIALAASRRRWQGVVVLVASVTWPVAHIGDVAVLAVAVNLALAAAFGTVCWAGPPAPGRPGDR